MYSIHAILDPVTRAVQILRYDRDNRRLLREYIQLKRQGK